MKKYTVYLPDYFYALTYFGINLQDVKKNVRDNLGMTRLPNGVEFIEEN